jgi:NAD(P)H-dependent FMN reductase
MPERRHLLVVSHSQSGGTRALIDALLDGARLAAADDVDVDVRSLDALAAGPDDVRWADAVVLATPENFGYMSGALKYFFDHTYYQVLDETRGTPYVLVVKGKHSDGSGALASIAPIVTGLGWREARPPLVVIGDVDATHLDEARELGQTVAASLDLGIL